MAGQAERYTELIATTASACNTDPAPDREEVLDARSAA
jgi:hypothetical protein